ncbi:deoxyribose-phosphate aldolase [Paucibacter sp. APW11]|uniref:Deoxyribose-phosphate aldolase n=1 Tax=Roseateles aquae TaxID=3077235 RepID=A0ABU3P8S6_9BURK|nr:deoxyribose-phosphate aldolase [Paucibacter sp. APW11]MDT8998972.1 deoxyribose-phosphate aldolase [Paucibacter sp. APW11]
MSESKNEQRLTHEEAARLALQCLDLTSLNDGDTEADIERLCLRAQSPFGAVAAVCVWPRFVALARRLLPAEIQVAAVADFPDGALDVPRALADVAAIAQAGGNEVDVVLPYKALIAGQQTEVAEFLAEVRHASRPLTLKVIIESGELATPELIAQATRLALMAGADFVKTSTGKSRVSATPEAAAMMLQEIAASGLPAAGFKASGGIRSVEDARVYLELAAAKLGREALQPRRLRFGASGLLDAIEAQLRGEGTQRSNAAY